jgi:hypothetical protein
MWLKIHMRKWESSRSHKSLLCSWENKLHEWAICIQHSISGTINFYLASSVGGCLRAGQLGQEFLTSLSCPDPDFHQVQPGFFPWAQSDVSGVLAVYLHLIPKLMCGALIPHSLIW